MTEQDDIPDLDDLRREARSWVVRIRSGEATADDSAELIRWAAHSAHHKVALRDAVRLQRLVAAAGLAEKAKMASAPAVPKARPSPHPTHLADRRAFLVGGGAAAASIAAAALVHPPLGLWPSLAELRSNYRTSTGQRRTIALDQGASIELNTRTSVAIRSDSRVDRLDLIAGEVAVDVSHPMRRVAIGTRDGEASASSGRFGVRLDETGTCVTCLEGHVAVMAHHAGNLMLTVGQQVTYRAGRLDRPVAVNAARVEAWRRGLLIFTDEPLSEVVDEINRYRPGKIILTNASLGRIPVNAVFQLDRIDLALQQIRSVASPRVTSLPGGIVLLS